MPAAVGATLRNPPPISITTPNMMNGCATK